LAHTVYNIKLERGDLIELGNRVYAATLGARFDTAGPGKEPIYSEEASRYLQDLSGYASGHIHWALGTASVDCDGMPSSKRLTDPPSKIGTSTLWKKISWKSSSSHNMQIKNGLIPSACYDESIAYGIT